MRWWLPGLLVVLLHGCAASPSTPPMNGPVTFNAHVSRLLQRHCQECHRPGEVAPFSLLTYGDTYARRDTILSVLGIVDLPRPEAAAREGGR